MTLRELLEVLQNLPDHYLDAPASVVPVVRRNDMTKERERAVQKKGGGDLHLTVEIEGIDSGHSNPVLIVKEPLKIEGIPDFTEIDGIGEETAERILRHLARH